jgi:hypothetical protein
VFLCSSRIHLASKTLRPLLILGFRAGAFRHPAGQWWRHSPASSGTCPVFGLLRSSKYGPKRCSTAIVRLQLAARNMKEEAASEQMKQASHPNPNRQLHPSTLGCSHGTRSATRLAAPLLWPPANCIPALLECGHSSYACTLAPSL